jgi:hypothetical protein
MVEMLQPGQIISYRVHEYDNSGIEADYVGTAPIVRIVRKAQNFRCHYVVVHEGRELDVYLDEVTKRTQPTLTKTARR